MKPLLRHPPPDAARSFTLWPLGHPAPALARATVGDVALEQHVVLVVRAISDRTGPVVRAAGVRAWTEDWSWSVSAEPLPLVGVIEVYFGHHSPPSRRAADCTSTTRELPHFTQYAQLPKTTAAPIRAVP